MTLYATNKKDSFSKHIKSFRGYLEGTLKSKNTIQSYLLDLGTFQEYLSIQFGKKPIQFHKISKADIDLYFDYLKDKKLKPNSRRRKLLTVRRFLRYLSGRKKFHLDISEKIPAPHKYEVVPFVLDLNTALKTVQDIKAGEWLEHRNQTLLLTLFETGCLVSEASLLKKSDCLFLENPKNLKIHFDGKNERDIQISPFLSTQLQKLTSMNKKESPWVFLGSNRHGPLKGHISSRGIELLIKGYRGLFQDEKLTARKIRHSVIFHWLKNKTTFSEVKLRLGLKSDYAYKSYEPLLKEFQKQENPT